MIGYTFVGSFMAPLFYVAVSTHLDAQQVLRLSTARGLYRQERRRSRLGVIRLRGASSTFQSQNRKPCTWRI